MGDRARSTLLLCLVFVGGGIAGGIGEHWFESRTVRAKANWTEGRSHALEQVKQDLALSDDQCQKMEKILDEAMQEFQDLHDRSHRVRQKTKDHILAILNDEQKSRFEASMAKLQKSLGAP
jgi:Spy/CpxP family protein refolding chaperone